MRDDELFQQLQPVLQWKKWVDLHAEHQALHQTESECEPKKQAARADHFGQGRAQSCLLFSLGPAEHDH